MNLERAEQIPGWFNRPEMEWLADQASRHSKIVEVGCWMGRSLRAMADNTDGTLWAVDTWRGSEEHQNDLKDKPWDWLYKEFCKNLWEYIESGKVKVLSGTSVGIAAHFWVIRNHNPESTIAPLFDMVFIDAAHDFDSISADIEAWKPLVRPGGLLCGHDHGHPPIARAVSELLPNAGSTVGIWHVTL